MTKADLVEEIANTTGLTKKDTALAVDHLIKAVKDALLEGHHIEIRGFGTFKVKQRKARTARNPRTGDPVQLPPRKVPIIPDARRERQLAPNTRLGWHGFGVRRRASHD